MLCYLLTYLLNSPSIEFNRRYFFLAFQIIALLLLKPVIDTSFIFAQLTVGYLSFHTWSLWSIFQLLEGRLDCGLSSDGWWYLAELGGLFFSSDDRIDRKFEKFRKPVFVLRPTKDWNAVNWSLPRQHPIRMPRGGLYEFKFKLQDGGSTCKFQNVLQTIRPADFGYLIQ